MRLVVATICTLLTVACDGEPTPPPETPATEPAAVPPETSTKEQTPDDEAFVESMQTLCRITKEVKSDTAIDPQDRPRETVVRFQATTPPPEVMKVLQTMAGVHPEARASRMAAEMAKRGSPNWACPELGEIN